MEHLVVFIFGLLFGSFANVIIFRLNTGESLIFGGSRCFFCGRNLKWFELVPVFSFLFLKGRCGNCGSKISWQYPLVELASGFLFLLVWLRSEPGSYHDGQSLALTILAIFVFWLLLVISVYDLRHKIIPNSLVYLSTAVAILFVFLDIGGLDLFRISDFGFRILSPYLLSGLGLFLFFAALWFVSRGRWLGFGDAKMALAFGLFLGWPTALAALLFSFWLGAVFGVGLLILKGIKGDNGSKGWKGIQIPFAPFLFSGGLAAYLWGESVISWYLSLI